MTNVEDIKNLYRHDLSSFMQLSFRELHPYANYQHNWHIDLIAHYLTEVEQGRIRRLIINMPPRTLKSHCVSVAWAAWLLGRDPRQKLLYLHAGRALGQDLENSCAALMSSRRYRSLFSSTVIKQQKQKLLNGFGGHRQFMPIMGRLTGLGADIIVIDDPMSTLDARDDHARSRLHAQFDENILQRLNSKRNGAIVLVMQRLHSDDLTSHILSKDENWAHLNLPAIALTDETWCLPHGQTYFRSKGQALQETREGREQLIEIMRAIGGYAFSYQYLQGLYKPRFGMDGQGGLWLNPMRDGVLYDCREDRGLQGFYYFKESDLILPKVFGIGDDPHPDNMRETLTAEEFEISCQVMRERYENDLKKRELR